MFESTAQSMKILQCTVFYTVTENKDNFLGLGGTKSGTRRLFTV